MAASVTVDWGGSTPPRGKESHNFGDVSGRTIRDVRTMVGRWLGPEYGAGSVGLNGNSVIDVSRHSHVLESGDRMTVNAEYVD